jgi:hypothetical protein
MQQKAREIDENGFQNIKIDKIYHPHQFESCKK